MRGGSLDGLLLMEWLARSALGIVLTGKGCGEGVRAEFISLRYGDIDGVACALGGWIKID
jgi:hypothetical protein